MTDVIDIQGFRDTRKKFIPKEVAAVSLQSRAIAHWIVRPPCNFTDLPTDIQQTNNYCSLDVHGIEWHEEDVSLKHLRKNLCNLAKNARRIYARGLEKARYLESVIARRVINLEDYDSPSYDELAFQFPNLLQCSTHVVKKFETKKQFCALRRAYQIKRWMHSLVDAIPT